MCLWMHLSICQETMQKNAQQNTSNNVLRDSPWSVILSQCWLPFFPQEPDINHPVFESGMNQREHTSDSQRLSTDIMTVAELRSGTLLNKEQPDLEKMHSSRLLWHGTSPVSFSCGCYCQDGDRQFSVHRAIVKTFNFPLLGAETIH